MSLDYSQVSGNPPTPSSPEQRQALPLPSDSPPCETNIQQEKDTSEKDNEKDISRASDIPETPFAIAQLR